MLSDMYQMN